MAEAATDGANAVAAMRRLADAQELRAQAEAACRECIRTASEEGDLGGLSPADIQVVFRRCVLAFDHGILSYPFIETAFDLCVADPTGGYFGGLRPVGSYRLLTRLDGTVDDDYFVLNEPRHPEPDGTTD
jgi:hypothetical protein